MKNSQSLYHKCRVKGFEGSREMTNKARQKDSVVAHTVGAKGRPNNFSASYLQTKTREVSVKEEMK